MMESSNNTAIVEARAVAARSAVACLKRLDTMLAEIYASIEQSSGEDTETKRAKCSAIFAASLPLSSCLVDRAQRLIDAYHNAI